MIKAGVKHSQKCPTCKLVLIGGYCYNCGEKSVDINEHSLKKYLGDALNAFTHFDEKFYTTIKYLLFYPGKLTREYLEGRRVKLMKPLQLFLVVTLLYFIFFKSFDLFYNDLHYTITNTDFFSVKAYDAALVKAEAKGKTLENFIVSFNYDAQNNAKAFVFLIIPILAVVVYCLFYKRYRHYVPHLVFTTHYFTFYLISWAFYTLLLMHPIKYISSEWFYNHKTWIEAIIILINLFYIAIALKKVYSQHWLWTILKALLITQVLIFIDQIYKVFITQFTLWSM